MESSDTSRQVAAGIKSSIPPEFFLVPSYSIKYNNPTTDLVINRNTQSTRPPVFRIVAGDPVMVAISNAMADNTSQANQAVFGGRVRVPFISATSKRRAAGSHPGDPPSYEQRLCERSNLRQTLTSFRSDRPFHPISATGGIFSNKVVVNLGPWNNSESVESPHHLPVVSVTPLRRPAVKGRGTIYSHEHEKNTMRGTICGALRICLYHRFNRVVIGDFGLGSVYRNPPQALAEIWRDVLLFDPVLRGQFAYVIFAFEDPTQSTTQGHWDTLLQCRERGRGRRLAAEGTSSNFTSNPMAAEDSHSESRAPTDMAVFQSVFHPHEIERVLQKPDPRCSMAMVLS
ncbi:hypothetical protein E4U17_005200 [Claviceps sp. LM77 group G4]|nr:hypothetical protein E4U17_005200 [Claviceps sp. LM77 group G4]KAG6067079.1 hypothetical protein E4U33_005373 [Claviceps sp. LM78 group G4]KAG6072157.1 hypothetical protein E4U16_005598 [Claviceps sp. LM84 group G4]